MGRYEFNKLINDELNRQTAAAMEYEAVMKDMGSKKDIINLLAILYVVGGVVLVAINLYSLTSILNLIGR